MHLIANDGAGRSSTDASISLESHLLALAAEESRISGKVIEFQTYTGDYK